MDYFVENGLFIIHAGVVGSDTNRRRSLSFSEALSFAIATSLSTADFVVRSQLQL